MTEKRRILPFFLVHKGCPHLCSFCKQSDISGSAEGATPLQIQNVTQQIPENAFYDEIAFYGGSFTMLPKGLQQQYYDAVSLALSEKRIGSIRVSTRPDGIDRAIAEELYRNGVRTVELGVQSMQDSVLLANQRGHDAKCVTEAVRYLRSVGMVVGLQMMTGLYGDSDEQAVDTARQLIELSPDFVRMYPVLVFRDTELERLYRACEYQPHTLRHAIELNVTIWLLFQTRGIPVIRMGLHEDSFHGSLGPIAGPHHPAFGELVIDRVYFEWSKHVLRDAKGAITISAPPKMIQHMAGHKGWVRKALIGPKISRMIVLQNNQTDDTISVLSDGVQAEYQATQIYRTVLQRRGYTET